MTGMRGVYLVAAELSRLGFIASPTSRSAIGADILVTDQACQRAYSVQVKTNAKTFGFWLMNKRSHKQISPTHIYAFVNIRKKGGEDSVEYYVVPSKVVSENIIESESPSGKWYSVYLKAIEGYRDNWSVFGEP